MGNVGSVNVKESSYRKIDCRFDTLYVDLDQRQQEREKQMIRFDKGKVESQSR